MNNLKLSDVKLLPTNESGIIPTGYRCVVKLDKVDEKIGSIHIPDQRQERNQMAATTGELIAIGGNAFTSGNDFNKWDGYTPQVGDRVVIEKYAGNFREADPNDVYRLVQDTDIMGIMA